MIETYLLEHLVAFKNHRTLSETAEALYLTQPTLTRSMNKLESEFGVPLFIRERKRLRLNEAGLLAVDYAERILQMQEMMLMQVKMRDRQLHTITVGSCAPGPVMELMPLLTSAFPQMVVSTEVKDEERLIKGLFEHVYQMIILSHPMQSADLFSHKCGEEQLCASLVSSHPYAYEDSVSFLQMDGESFLMAAEVGFWGDIVRQKMPSSTFLLQDGTEALREVASTSSLSSFATDVTLRVLGARGPRIAVPFSDAEAHTEYYCICPAQEKDRYARWFETLGRYYA